MYLTETQLFSIAISLLCLLTVGCGPSGGEGGDASITITRPAQGSIVAESRFKVRGEASGVDELEVNGEPVDVVGGEWNVLLEFAQGSATVEATGGGAHASADFTVDSISPSIELETPERAQYVPVGESTTVTVSGSASDTGTGLRAVSLGNSVLELTGEGAFDKEVELQAGLNTLEISAIDEAGNESTALRGVMHGEFVDPTARIEPGLNMKVGSGAIDAGEKVVENLLTPQRTTQFAKQNVDNDKFAISAIDYETLDVEIEPKPNRLAATVSVEKLELEGEAKLSGETYPVVVTIDRASIVADIIPSVEDNPSVDDNPRIDVAFENAELNLAKESFHFSLKDNGNKKEVDSDSLRKLAVTIAENAFSSVLSDDVFAQLWNPSVLKRRVELLGRTLVFEVVPLRFRVRNDGLFFDAGFKLPVGRHVRVPEVPGALARVLGEFNVSGASAEMKFRTNRTAVDQIVHGVWRSGLFHQVIDRQQLSGYDLPVDLTAGALGVALDHRITGLADDDTPAAIRLRPQLPPVTQFRSAEGGSSSSSTQQGAGRVRVRAGEFLIDLLLQTDGEPTEIATVATFVDLEVGVGLDGFAIDLEISAEARADLVEEPEIDFDDREIEEVVAGIFEAVPELMGEKMTIQGESELEWIELQNPRVEVGGSREDWISMFVDVEPAQSNR